MKTRRYTPADYRFLEAWWILHGIPPVPEAMLPKCGVIVEREEEPVAFGCVYMDNSVGVAFMAYLTVSPDEVARLCGAKTTLVLIGALEAILKQFDYTVVVITSAVPALVKILKKAGYSTCHASTWEGMKTLN